MKYALLIVLTLGSLSGCVGWETDKPPIVGIRNMYNQPRYDTQEEKPFFADRRSMRPEIEGTVSKEMEQILSWSTGRDVNDESWLMEVPEPIVKRVGGPEAMLTRGQGRYEIYCSVCHSYSGTGKGMVSRRADQLGFSGLVAPSLHDDRLRHIPDGQLYATITNGVRNMPGYASNIPSDDRWSIVLYIRALQLTQAPQAAATPTEPTEQTP